MGLANFGGKWEPEGDRRSFKKTKVKGVFEGSMRCREGVGWSRKAHSGGLAVWAVRPHS